MEGRREKERERWRDIETEKTLRQRGALKERETDRLIIAVKYLFLLFFFRSLYEGQNVFGMDSSFFFTRKLQLIV